jgi:hypothetical protein
MNCQKQLQKIDWNSKKNAPKRAFDIYKKNSLMAILDILRLQ